jgi:hypothetical protein
MSIIVARGYGAHYAFGTRSDPDATCVRTA